MRTCATHLVHRSSHHPQVSARPRFTLQRQFTAYTGTGDDNTLGQLCHQFVALRSLFVGQPFCLRARTHDRQAPCGDGRFPIPFQLRVDYRPRQHRYHRAARLEFQLQRRLLQR